MNKKEKGTQESLKNKKNQSKHRKANCKDYRLFKKPEFHMKQTQRITQEDSPMQMLYATVEIKHSSVTAEKISLMISKMRGFPLLKTIETLYQRLKLRMTKTRMSMGSTNTMTKKTIKIRWLCQKILSVQNREKEKD